MRFGRFGSFPFRFGGGEALAKTIYDSLNSSLGSAYETSDESTVTAETYAEAKILAAAWSMSKKAANQLDPWRMTDFLPRWEKIFGLSSSGTDTERRSRVASKFLTLSDPTEAALTTVASTALGAAFVGIEYTAPDTALILWPSTGYATMWSSTVSHIVIRVQLPAGWSDGALMARIGTTMQIARNFVADYDTLDWAVYNGDGDEGFILDEDGNLDGQTFDA